MTCAKSTSEPNPATGLRLHLTSVSDHSLRLDICRIVVEAPLLRGLRFGSRTAGGLDAERGRSKALSASDWTPSKQKTQPPSGQLTLDDLLLTVQVEKYSPDVVTMSDRGDCITRPDGWATGKAEEPESIEPR